MIEIIFEFFPSSNSCTCAELPESPTGLSTTPFSHSIMVTWRSTQSSKEQTHVVIWCPESALSTCSEETNINETSLKIGGLEPFVVYRITVKSRNNFGYSKNNSYIYSFILREYTVSLAHYKY